MSSKADKNITTYISPIVKSTTPYDLLERSKYKIHVVDDLTGEADETEVVNVPDVLSIIMTSQLEASVILMERLLKDNNIVLHDDLQESFKKYTNDLRKVINNPETFLKNENS